MEDHDDKPSVRARVLYTAAKLTTGDRNNTYGSPYINMSRTAQMIESYIRAKYSIDITLSAEDAAMIMVLVKMTRTMHSALHPDNYIDAAAYMAMAAECADEDHEE